MQAEYGYTIATEEELNDLLVGKPAITAFPWPGYSIGHSVPSGSTGVVWKKRSADDIIQPIALISREEDYKRLFGRFAQLRSDLSPLTAWCHFLSIKHFESLRSSDRDTDLAGWEAAWTGLIIAEAQLLAEKSLRDLRLPACLATQTFAIARTAALWGDFKDNDLVSRFDAANRVTRMKNGAHSGENRINKVRTALEFIWTTLLAVVRGGTRAHDKLITPIVESLIVLDVARRQKDINESEKFMRPLLSVVPEAKALQNLRKLPAEQRLNIFDQFVSELRDDKTPNALLRHSALALMAGYITTVAAGGTPTLALAEDISSTWPEVTGWAYVVGSIGEPITWSSGFDGLGRLVSRELMRSFRVEEPPTCDFAIDEAFVLLDTTLPDPLVHLRIKQNKVATIALFPGVNVTVPINEINKQESKAHITPSEVPAEQTKPNRDLGAVLADAVWPHLRSRVENLVQLSEDNDTYRPVHGRGNKPRSPSQLPFRRSKG